MATTPVYIRQTESTEKLKHGHKNVAVGGTAVPLSSTSVPCYDLIVQAKSANVGKIYIGASDVPNTEAGGVFLSQGQTWNSYVNDLNAIYINATSAGDGVTFIYWDGKI